MAQHKRKRKLTKAGKILIGVVSVLIVVLVVFGISKILPKEKNDVIDNPVTTPSAVTVSNELGDKYNSIYEEYHTLNSDYVGKLEFKNNLLYNYSEDCEDKYPGLVVKSHIIEDEQGDVNAANAEYLRMDITRTDKDFGQEFMDGSNILDENNLPVDQNIIIYGHFVYRDHNLKFGPLHTFEDASTYDTYDTFTLTMNHEQRTYVVTDAFFYDKNDFNGSREESPFATNYTKEQLEEIVRIALEMRRRVKEQLKKIGGMEFYDVNFSYIDKDTFEERYVSVPEQGSSTLIPEGMCNPGQVYTVSTGKSGMIGLFRLESQTLPGNGKFTCNGIGNEREARESTQNAFNYLKANSNRISQSIGTTTKDFIVQYQDLQGIGMTSTLALPTLIALCSIALQKPTVSSLAILGEISVSGTVSKVENLANTLQVCLDSGAKKVLLPITSAVDLGTVPAELVGCFNLIFFNSAEDAVFKALGVE